MVRPASVRRSLSNNAKQSNRFSRPSRVNNNNYGARRQVHRSPTCLGPDSIPVGPRGSSGSGTWSGRGQPHRSTSSEVNSGISPRKEEDGIDEKTRKDIRKRQAYRRSLARRIEEKVRGETKSNKVVKPKPRIIDPHVIEAAPGERFVIPQLLPIKDESAEEKEQRIAKKEDRLDEAEHHLNRYWEIIVTRRLDSLTGPESQSLRDFFKEWRNLEMLKLPELATMGFAEAKAEIVKRRNDPKHAAKVEAAKKVKLGLIRARLLRELNERDTASDPQAMCMVLDNGKYRLGSGLADGRSINKDLSRHSGGCCLPRDTNTETDTDESDF